MHKTAVNPQGTAVPGWDSFGWLVSVGFLLVPLAASPGRGGEVDYLERVKPLLRERCYACHGGLKQEAGLRLDTVQAIVKGGDSGSAIRRGNPAESLLLERVSAADVAERMPPAGEGEPLSPEQLALLRQWIAAGAAGPADERPEADPQDHWAFQPVVRPAVPSAGQLAWCRNPVDAFLAERHRQQGLEPQPEAPRLILLRRLYLDLVGIPPSPAEIATCLSDPSPQWYERTVDRLLSDARHGERWARHWMDVWRYSDWWGLGQQLRNSQPHIWHWRDWIVESLNADTPYDEMVRQMLAADELYPGDLEKLRATGYLARNWFLFNRNQWLEETVEHVSKGFLGLTMNCTKCHDHKYDAIEQVDFYRMRAFFEPYHVRVDVVPGEPDLTRDGIPRVFDGVLDAPTYRFVRGDEKNPDKSAAIAPGVPDILAFKPLEIEPVTLPAEAWQPGRRAWVAEAHLAAAQRRLQSAETALEETRQKLQSAIELEAELAAGIASPPPDPAAESAGQRIKENFKTLDANRWQLCGGRWVHHPGRLEQRQDGASRSALRLLARPPRDFVAVVRFRIEGGSRWRSVGLSFDASQPDPTRSPAAGDSEVNVYVSAVAGGSKVQASYQQGGRWTYPAGEAMRPLPIELGRDYTLQVQVRDTLVNASLDGQPVIAWRCPIARREGSLGLTTFDALAVFYDVSIAPLGSEVVLREPAGPQAGKPQSPAAARLAVDDARREVAVAEASAELARAELESVQLRAAALPAAGADETRKPRQIRIAAAVKAERRVALARARRALADAELQAGRAPDDGKAAAEKDIAKAQEALQHAEENVAAPVADGATFTPLVGAAWTPTRFLNSGQDDPTVEFPPVSTGRRTALAGWIADRRNPLTARVAVNHIWTRHMGEPLVATVFDFGRNGARPTHPELLDWLAAELMDSGWSMKHLHRVIVTSAAYRMSSSAARGRSSEAKDPDNRYWWRRRPQRLESQVVRDSLLALAGTLDITRGGPPVPAAEQANSKRRSLYFFHSNNDRNLFLTTFDEALVKDCYRRESSIVPQQALALTNSALVLDAAGQIAERVSAEAADETDFIRQAFAVVLGIEAGAEELAASRAALRAWCELPAETAAAARAHLVWALINHNDFVTLR